MFVIHKVLFLWHLWRFEEGRKKARRMEVLQSISPEDRLRITEESHDELLKWNNIV